jgi:hypothetical protein
MPSSRNACRRNNIRGTAKLPIDDFHYSYAGEGRLLLAGATRYSSLHPLRSGIVLAGRLGGSTMSTTQTLISEVGSARK